jgi:tetratricopeptide (TPR) repeat protein
VARCSQAADATDRGAIDMKPTPATPAVSGGACDAVTLFRTGGYAALATSGTDRGSDGILAARALALLDRLDEAACLLERIATLDGEAATAAAVEREHVALRGYAPADGVLARLDSLPSLPVEGAAHGRRLVVRATALSRLHRLDEATATALEAVEVFTALGAVDERARALYAAGKILAWTGDLEQAGLRLALALADWATVGNVPETAITITGLGRLNVAARRFAHAIDFLQRARDLSPFPDTSRAGIRIRHGSARAMCGLERSVEAQAMLVAAAADARSAGITYLEFICVRDAAIAAARHGDATRATTLLDQAAAIIGAQDSKSYDAASLILARGAVASALDQPDAVDILEHAARAVAGRRLGAPEIDNLRLLAKSLIRGGRVREAERHLTSAYRLATGKGLSWHRREIRMDLARLRVAEGALVETDRQIHRVDSSSPAERLPEHGYLIRARLGGGTFGEVFRAYDLDNAREVAIKRLSFTGLYDVDRAAAIIASVERELDAATRVEHPGVARVYGLNRSGGGEFHLVQEFVEGPSLRSWMAAERVPDPHVVAHIALRIAQPLSAIHRAGVIHRDLKPENVMLRNGEDPVIIDFGIAHVDRPGAAPPPGLGTPAYMPPEQAAGRRLDARCDVFALGAIILEWLAGLPADDPAAAPLRRVAGRMARQRRWQRPASMDAVIEMIREAVEGG